MKRISTVLTLIVLLPLAGCAVKQQSWGDPETGLTLTYRLPEDQTLRYRTTVEQKHSMKAMGQPREFEAEKSLEVSMQSEDRDEGGHQLTVAVDSLHWWLDTPRGEIERDIPKVLGKSFGMVLSPLGEESDFTDFSEVEVGSAFEVWIIQADSYRLSITADENLFEKINVSKNDKKLKIGLHRAHYVDTTTRAVITLPNLGKLRLSGPSSR